MRGAGEQITEGAYESRKDADREQMRMIEERSEGEEKQKKPEERRVKEKERSLTVHAVYETNTGETKVRQLNVAVLVH